MPVELLPRFGIVGRLRAQSSSRPPIGLIVCDEGRLPLELGELHLTVFAGHRLKSANNKTSRMFDALKTPRRIILSGTPIQNDLGEFHTMVRSYDSTSFLRADREFNQAEFCNPGLLGTVSCRRVTTVITKRVQVTTAPFERNMSIRSSRAGHPRAQRPKPSLERQN